LDVSTGLGSRALGAVNLCKSEPEAIRRSLRSTGEEGCTDAGEDGSSIERRPRGRTSAPSGETERRFLWAGKMGSPKGERMVKNGFTFFCVTVGEGGRTGAGEDRSWNPVPSSLKSRSSSAGGAADHGPRHASWDGNALCGGTATAMDMCESTSIAWSLSVGESGGGADVGPWGVGASHAKGSVGREALVVPTLGLDGGCEGTGVAEAAASLDASRKRRAPLVSARGRELRDPTVAAAILTGAGEMSIAKSDASAACPGAKSAFAPRGGEWRDMDASKLSSRSEERKSSNSSFLDSVGTRESVGAGAGAGGGARKTVGALRNMWSRVRTKGSLMVVVAVVVFEARERLRASRMPVGAVRRGMREGGTTGMVGFKRIRV
jgi:hypothetical protein